MLYYPLNKVTMRMPALFSRQTLWVILGLALGFSSLAIAPHTPLAQSATTTPVLATQAIETTFETQQDLGSTDGIVFLAVVIVLIVVLPILLRRSTWSQLPQRKKEPHKGA